MDQSSNQEPRSGDLEPQGSSGGERQLQLNPAIIPVPEAHRRIKVDDVTTLIYNDQTGKYATVKTVKVDNVSGSKQSLQAPVKRKAAKAASVKKVKIAKSIANASKKGVVSDSVQVQDGSNSKQTVTMVGDPVEMDHQPFGDMPQNLLQKPGPKVGSHDWLLMMMRQRQASENAEKAHASPNVDNHEVGKNGGGDVMGTGGGILTMSNSVQGNEGVDRNNVLAGDGGITADPDNLALAHAGGFGTAAGIANSNLTNNGLAGDIGITADTGNLTLGFGTTAGNANSNLTHAGAFGNTVGNAQLNLAHAGGFTHDGGFANPNLNLAHAGVSGITANANLNMVNAGVVGHTAGPTNFGMAHAVGFGAPGNLNPGMAHAGVYGNAAGLGNQIHPGGFGNVMGQGHLSNVAVPSNLTHSHALGFGVSTGPYGTGLRPGVRSGQMGCGVTPGQSYHDGGYGAHNQYVHAGGFGSTANLGYSGIGVHPQGLQYPYNQQYPQNQAASLGTGTQAYYQAMANHYAAMAAGATPQLPSTSGFRSDLMAATIETEGEDDRPSYLIYPGNTPAVANVLSTHRAVIWSRQYFDLTKLRRWAKKPDMDLKVVDKPGGRGKGLKAYDGSKRAIRSFEEWCELFLRFMAVYAEQYPAELPAMLTYVEAIRGLSKNCGLYAFLTYDENAMTMPSFGGQPERE